MHIRSLLIALLSATQLLHAEPSPLFDGKTFTGWDGDTKTTWRIENGEIVAGDVTKQQPRNEFLSTLKRFENFELRLKLIRAWQLRA